MKIGAGLILPRGALWTKLFPRILCTRRMVHGIFVGLIADKFLKRNKMNTENINYCKTLKDMSDEDLLLEMDSASLIINGFSEQKKIQGMAGRAQLRFNAVATEILKRSIRLDP
jgi:hypothetical protein